MGRLDISMRCIEIRSLLDEGELEQAYEIAENLDIERVTSIVDLKVIASVYERMGKYEDAMDILHRSYEKRPTKMVVYRLAYLCVKAENFDDAEFFYREFVDMAPNSPDKYILRYGIDRAKGVDYYVRIATLQKLKSVDYREEWGYELAKVYHKAGLYEDCVRECDDLILWFGEGIIVEKAKLLKKYHTEGKSSLDAYGIFEKNLTTEQVEYNREKFRFDTQDLGRQIRELAETEEEHQLKGDLERDLEKTIDLRKAMIEDTEALDLLGREVHRSWGSAAPVQGSEVIQIKKLRAKNEQSGFWKRKKNTPDMEEILAEEEQDTDVLPTEEDWEIRESVAIQPKFQAAKLQEELAKEIARFNEEDASERELIDDYSYEPFYDEKKYEDFLVYQEEPANEETLDYEEEFMKEEEPDYEETLDYEEVTVKEEESGYKETLDYEEELVQEEEPSYKETLKYKEELMKEEELINEETPDYEEVTVKKEESDYEETLDYKEVTVKKEEPSYEETPDNKEELVKEEQNSEELPIYEKEQNHTEQLGHEQDKKQDYGQVLMYEKDQNYEEASMQEEQNSEEPEIPAYVQRDRPNMNQDIAQENEEKTENMVGEEKTMNIFRRLLNRRNNNKQEENTEKVIEKTKNIGEDIENEKNTKEIAEEIKNTKNTEEEKNENTDDKKNNSEFANETEESTETELVQELSERVGARVNVVKVKPATMKENKKQAKAQIPSKDKEYKKTVTTGVVKRYMGKNTQDMTAEYEDNLQVSMAEGIETPMEEERNESCVSIEDVYNLFSRYQQNTQVCEEMFVFLQRVLDKKQPGNIIITSKSSDYAKVLCADIADVLQEYGVLDNKQPVSISAENLNKMHLEQNYERVKGRVMQITGARKITPDTAQSIMNMVEELGNNVIVVLNDGKPYMDDFMNEYKIMQKYFPHWIIL